MRCLGFPVPHAAALLCCAASLLSCISAFPQGQPMGAAHSMADMQPIPPPDQLPAPIKMSGIGNSHISIRATPEAEAWFDQGLSLLNDFWDYEAAKAFEQSVRVDPNCAMCYWGLAQAIEMHGGSVVKLYVDQAMKMAERLKSRAGATDKLYIDAAEADQKPSDPGESPAIPILRKLVKKAPHDIEARIFLANAVGDGFDEKDEPKPGEKEKIAILEGVLKEAPNDSAANHYWIHAMEPSIHPERAIPSAALLASLAPTSGHMVHMPGHIYFRVGDYAQAEHWFAASMTADETYMRDQHVSVDNDWNYVHNMMYAIANLMEQGKLAEANTLSDHLADARGKLSPSLYIWSARDQMARVSRRLPVALRTADWNTASTLLAQANLPDTDNTSNLRFLASELSDFANGMKALESNDVAAAQIASDRMDAGLWRTKRTNDAAEEAKKKADDLAKKNAAADNQQPAMPVSPDALARPLIQSLSVASIELHAGILIAQGKLEEGKKQFALAIAQERKLGYHEPPIYIRPVGENEAVALIRAKDYAGATAAYQDALKERPNSGFPLYGLAHVRELSGDASGARQAYDAFLKAWPAADPVLPEVLHAREITSSANLAVR
ncbi:MAG TPA: tetratricopeptide repeat protein [Terracidiphilus sp.]|nr:tetratricopeptide repeat protein [Terracidiphilus sp.]